MPAVTQFRYTHALDAMERSLTESLRLTPLHLQTIAPDGFPGAWKGAAVTLKFRAWSGPKVAVARSVTLEGHELEIANFVAVARRPLEAPILGIDLISARPDAGLVVADLSPLSGPGCSVPGIPDWARMIFSNDPIFTRVTPDTAPDTLSRVKGLCDRFAALVTDAVPHPSPDRRDAAVKQYREQHLQDDRMRAMLAHIFGADAATTLMSGVLFPPELSDDVCA